MTKTYLFLSSAVVIIILIIAGAVFFSSYQARLASDAAENEPGFTRLVKESSSSKQTNRNKAGCPLFDKGDYDCSGSIDIADYDLWAGEFGGNSINPKSDGTGDGEVSLQDYEVWRSGFTSL